MKPGGAFKLGSSLHIRPHLVVLGAVERLAVPRCRGASSETRFKLKALLLSLSQSKFETERFQARVELALPPHQASVVWMPFRLDLSYLMSFTFFHFHAPRRRGLSASSNKAKQYFQGQARYSEIHRRAIRSMSIQCAWSVPYDSCVTKWRGG